MSKPEMSLSRYPQVTPELLSAYIDDAVTPEERALVERAVANDATIAAQLASLQQTVQLLHTLPALTLPRSFTLDALTLEIAAEQAAEAEHSRALIPPKEYQLTPEPVSRRNSRWQQLLQAFQGFPLYRNAAMVAALLLIAVLAGNWSYLYNGMSPSSQDAVPEAQLAMVDMTATSRENVVALQRGATADAAVTVDMNDDVNENAAVAATAVDQALPAVNPAVGEGIATTATPNQPTAVAVAIVEAAPTAQVADTDGLSAKMDAATVAPSGSPAAVETATGQLAVAVPDPAVDSGNPAAVARAESSGDSMTSGNMASDNMASDNMDSMRGPGDDAQDLNPSAPAMRTMAQPSAEQQTLAQENGPATSPVPADDVSTESEDVAQDSGDTDGTTAAGNTERVPAEEAEVDEHGDTAVAVAQLEEAPFDEETSGEQPITDDVVIAAAINATATGDAAVAVTDLSATVTETLTTTPSIMAFSAVTTTTVTTTAVTTAAVTTDDVVTNAVVTDSVTITVATSVITSVMTVTDEIEAEEPAATVTKAATPRPTRIPTLVPKLTPTVLPTVAPIQVLTAPLSPLATPAITATVTVTTALPVTTTMMPTVSVTATNAEK